ncbi:MAG TPA: amidase [Mycobacteriales bacterium]|nr:amidase [Mycobacteriales bacterium]
MTAAQQARAVATWETTAAELVEAALERITATDGDVRAFVRVATDRARSEAAALDVETRSGRSRGPLHGVPVAVKDLFDVAGEVTTAGSEVPPDPPAAADATAVARLRAAGAVVIGRTRTHEFAWGLTTRHPRLGGTHNPHAPDRVAGGSSGGSAAAVALGVVPIALGTDTAGSIRLPAAWCGVVGHKPTWGAVPTHGVLPLAPSCDHVGALTGDVADARIALSVLTGQDVRAGRRDAAGLRVGVSTDVGPAARCVVDAVERAAARLGDSGATVRPVSLPDPGEVAAVFFAVQAGEALAWHRGSGRWPACADRYGADVAARLRRAESTDLSAAGRRTAIVSAAGDLFRDVDVVVLPVAAAGPSSVDDPDQMLVDGVLTDLRDAVLAHTLLASVCGLPACSVPAGRDDDGLPLGVQVVGRPGADALVLDVAELIEQSQQPLSTKGHAWQRST